MGGTEFYAGLRVQMTRTCFKVASIWYSAGWIFLHCVKNPNLKHIQSWRGRTPQMTSDCIILVFFSLWGSFLNLWKPLSSGLLNWISRMLKTASHCPLPHLSPGALCPVFLLSMFIWWLPTPVCHSVVLATCPACCFVAWWSTQLALKIAPLFCQFSSSMILQFT